MSDEIETRRKRAAWRAAHRGTKELDILVGTYAGAKLPHMAPDALGRFEEFLAVTDPELQSWLLNPEPGVTGGEFADLVSDIRAFHGLA